MAMNPPRPTPDTPTVNAGYARLMASVLRARGFDVAALLRSAGLGDEATLAARQAPYSLREIDALVAAAQRAGAGPHFALEVGAALRVSTHGPLGYAVASSADLRQALRALVRYGALRNASLGYRLRDTATGGDLEVVEQVDLGVTRGFYLLTMFAVLLQLLEAVVGPAAAEARVDLPLPEDGYRVAVQRHFAGSVRYGSARLVFHLDEALLARPALTADAQAHAQALQACEQQAAAQRVAAQASFAERVRELLRGPAAQEGRYPTLDEAARHFDITARTLIRRLQREGTRWQALLDESRKQRAWWYLLHTPHPVEEIAARLGYQDTRNFSRCFRRWHGSTPSAVRRGAQPLRACRPCAKAKLLPENRNS
jgi:AraC-like DNA-binding protein